MTYGVALNIIGGEWVIIIFVALVLILGTNKLPEAAKKMGKVVTSTFNWTLACLYLKSAQGLQI